MYSVEYIVQVQIGDNTWFTIETDIITREWAKICAFNAMMLYGAETRVVSVRSRNNYNDIKLRWQEVGF